jgi:aminoglycoside phosphotransferase (APT) family kinase protein
MHGGGFLFTASEANRREVWWRSLQVMADLHRVDWCSAAFDFLERPIDGRDALTKRIALMRRLVDWASPAPIPSVERSLAWLADERPNPAHLTLCWTDPRPGNIVFKDYRPVAALDWEGLCIGPPENDLAYFLLVDEVAYKAHGVPRLTGLPDAADTIARYEQLTGRRTENLDYCFVMQAAWLAIMLAISAKVVLARGIKGFPEDYASNNVATARLDGLLAAVR